VDECFDLANDPLERRNMAGAHRKKVRDLKRRLRDTVARLKPLAPPDADIGPDPEMVDELKSLGYLQ
jgi:hypothetical protein